MGRFIPMPWDEPTQHRWSDGEISMALRLNSEGLNRAQIADALAEAGFPARDDTAIDQKLRDLAHA